MLAPPGYAKIVSTPSRSRQATMISQPNIAGPTSARSVCLVSIFGAAVFFVLVFIFVIGCQPRANKKPTVVTLRRSPAVGCCRNSRLASTSANGGVPYDYQRDYLSNL